jgi:uncharacterized protein with HEPN domain
MSRHDDQRLADILAAAAAIADHTNRGGLDDGLVFDAVRVRLIEIGEAVKAIDPTLLAREPDIPWVDVAGMRNQLAHRYFDTAHAIVQATVSDDLPLLVAATRRLLHHLTGEPNTERMRAHGIDLLIFGLTLGRKLPPTDASNAQPAARITSKDEQTAR